jgi:hypothetical protein
VLGRFHFQNAPAALIQPGAYLIQQFFIQHPRRIRNVQPPDHLLRHPPCPHNFIASGQIIILLPSTMDRFTETPGFDLEYHLSNRLYLDYSADLANEQRIESDQHPHCPSPLFSQAHTHHQSTDA